MVNLRANSNNEFNSVRRELLRFLLIRSVNTISKDNKTIKEITSFAGFFTNKNIEFSMSNISIISMEKTLA